MDRKVTAWFSGEQSRASDYLHTQGFQYSESRNWFYRQINFNGDKLYLHIQLPQNYPLEYPKFFIDSNEWYLKYPHVEGYKNGVGSSICYLADTDKIPYLDGEKIIQVELDRILNIIDQYEREEYKLQDFLEEFDSYWNDKIYYFDLDESMNEPKIVNVPYYKGFGHVFTDNLDSTSMKFELLNRNQEYTLKALFVPLLNISTPLPTTRNAFVDILKEAEVFGFVEEFFVKKDVSPILLFGFHIQEKLHFSAVEFPLIEKGRKKVVFPVFSPDSSIERIRVKRIDRERIFTRGGSATTQNIARNEVKLAIIGCGALGGSLAFKLAKSGIRNFLLIDNQLLSIDNIGRHICGMRFVSVNKVDAVKTMILEQFPDCNIETCDQNIMENLSLLDTVDLIVSALGSDGTAFEHFYNQVGNKSRIYTWFEGHLAGHSVLIKDTPNVNIATLNDNIRVVDTNYIDNLNRKEIGCNQFYTPYSYLDAENTVNMVARQIVEFVHRGGDIEESVMTVLGDLVGSTEMIRPYYHGYESYSVIKRALQDVM